MKHNRIDVTSKCLIALLVAFASLNAYGQQVHQLSYDNFVWADQNLNGAFTDSGSDVAAFAVGTGLHVYYLSNVSEVHQSYNVGGGWNDENLTAETHQNPANSISNVVGFPIGDFQYVFYVGNDFCVHQLLYNDSAWADTNLNAASGAPISNGRELAAITTGSNGLHVYYVTPGPSVMQLYNVGNGWQFENLTSETGGPQPEGRSMTGFSVGNYQYLYYVAFGGDVHEMVYNNAKWSDEDVTALAKAVPSPMYPDGALSAFVVPGTTKLRVYYIGTNQHVIQLASTNNKKWSTADLTKKTKGPLANLGNGLVGFATTPNNQLHVYYASGTQVNELFLPTPSTKWTNTDLTQSADGGLVSGTTEMSGFSLQNLQYVYYVAQ